ncbi:DUF4397 domain-containing protein [Mucilaginibacter sp. UR6-1]|uniref:DUF4397 domain-containing protein n=1 Tax=Mucilaginibacter sp. UR6-1 TaxID=1435643 RepID=UPI001E5A5DE4|nr:DUF4397 domain-containing protein [Mucilaginibacter sp. UR6-1]MCC8408817.1 DUF4397 domain-containing protein [Mucilaginibacter sp. UR6-1]
MFNKIKNTKLLSLSFILLATVSLTSCDKNDDENVDADSASVRITNAVEGSLSQEVYIGGTKLNTSAVAYGETSNYIETASGDNKAVQFRNVGSSSANVSFNVDLDDDDHYSLYYAGNTNAKTYVVAKDDRKAPSSGKAKVRFIHLASAVQNNVDLGFSATEKLFTGVAYKAITAYKEIDANTQLFLYAAGQANVVLDLDTKVQAGKIYTIYVSGSTAITLKYHVIAEN